MTKKIRSFFIFLALGVCLNASSQDIKSAYLQVSWLSGYKYSGTLTLLTDNNINVIRPYVRVNWGIKTDTLFLINETPVSTGILKKYYGTCTFPGPGTYQIIYIDSLRVPAIQNISQSEYQKLKLTSILKIPTFDVPDTAPLMQNSEIRLTTASGKAIFDPQILDAENDSLSFQLVPCFAASYRSPAGVSVNDRGVVSFSRDSIGRYAFSFIVTEWRKDGDLNYRNIGSSQADFVMDIATNVSLSENETASIVVYPNPVTSILHISNEQNELRNASVAITNSLGQSVLQVPFQESIDVSVLPSGYYSISIKKSHGSVLRAKFIKE